MLTAFSPRKQNVRLSDAALVRTPRSAGQARSLVREGCLYIKRLSDLHMPTLTKLVKASVADIRKAHS